MLNKILMTALFLSISISAFAGDNAVTPYGDSCRGCTTYGICKDPVSPKEAMVVIGAYYRDKGYKVGTIEHRGRFIEAEIYEGNRLVDKVLFDRKTGRIRSIL